MSKKLDKLHKQAIREQQKRFKPGECQKYVRLVLDSGLLGMDLGQQLVEQLNLTDMNYEIRKLSARNCIIWERNMGQQKLAHNANGTGLDPAWEMQKQVLQLVSSEDFRRAVKEKSLGCIGASLHIAYPDRQFFVAVHIKNNDAHALIEMQLLQNLHVVQLSSKSPGSELSTLLARFTKAIAEAPYKQQRHELLGSFKKYLANDNKQCVRVEQGTGYGRLWQQHLNRLPMVTLEVAESIIANYPCPKRLLADFDDEPTAVQTLADMKIKRGNGPQLLHSERRIGNVLSSKLYTLYNARDPNTLI